MKINSSFWKNKSHQRRKYSLLANCEEVTKELNNFFSNAVKYLNISHYENCKSLAENIDDLTVKAIATWGNDPSILAIVSEYKNRTNLCFQFGF